MLKNSKLTNMILFQAGWWSCLLSAHYGIHILALFTFVTALVAIQFIYVVEASKRKNEFKFYVLLLTVGFLVDGLFGYFGVLSFKGQQGYLAPTWMLGMWMLFPISIGYSFSWLQGKKMLAFILGAVGGPMTYKVGASFDLVDINSIPSILIYALYWGLVFVGCLYIYKQMVIQRIKL
jgi:hypothetical protein